MSNQESGQETRRRRATLAEVARRANVSTTTASLVMSGKALELRIPQETSDRVTLAADEIGYVPNQLLRSIRRGRTHIVSFYSAFRHREADDLYTQRMTSAIEYAGSLFGHDILMHCNFWRKTEEVYQFLNGGWADGLLFYAPFKDDPLLPMLRNSKLPTVIVNKHDYEGVLHSVCSDEEAGMRFVTNALVGRGHRRIVSLDQHGWDYRDADERVALLDRFLGEYGVERPEEDRLSVGLPLTFLLESVMSRPEPPTAIFCWHDRLAYKLLEACDEMGIKVPEELSVVGYDGLHWPSSSRHVVASVRVNMGEIAVRSMGMLAALIEGRSVPLKDNVPVLFDPGTTLAMNPSYRSTWEAQRRGDEDHESSF